MDHTKYTLITGASTGLGKELALCCAAAGMHLILTALPGGNMASLAAEIMRNYPVEVVAYEFDLTDPIALKTHTDEIMSRYAINFLINNAGMGGTSSITETSLERIDRIILLNVRSTVMLTRLLIPQLLQHEKSYIMNISSMAAFTPIAYKTVYPASKAFISSFSLGLREEFSGTGLSVSVVCPGPMMTNSRTSRRIISQGLKGKMGLLPAATIAQIALRGTLAQRSLIIPGMMNQVNHLLMRLLPPLMKLRIVSREVKKEMQYEG
ncbi:SDR family NAD(P)-dependent oxidoreductase [Chitinophaga vietnamensis]|uniref:SDR family NAD(P)-dependent oxidoreductase n=1 Tax=Chitinophaga vietnamensis TaxID=2593957 RepID=UPI001178C2F3|nr:SDR family NAD(P)-dependent oxidoreductase [Chitinophaga vietnamensis]